MVVESTNLHDGLDDSMAHRTSVVLMILALSLAGCSDSTDVRSQPAPTAKQDQRDGKETVSALEKLAESGDATALLSLGDRYHRGDGVMRDDSKAFSLVSRAASQGHADAESYVAFLHLTGQGTVQDTEAAKTNFSSAARKGDCLAIMFMAYLDSGEISSANPKWLQMPPNATCAPLLVARVEATLRKGDVFESYKTWAQAGREKEYWLKEYSIGEKLYRDVFKDLESAANSDSANELQRRYDQFAEEYFRLLFFASKDLPVLWGLSPPSKSSLSQFENQIEDKERLKRILDTLPVLRPYQYAVAEAQFKLGEIFRYGLGLEGSWPVFASQWLAKAAASGHPGAAVELGDMYLQGHGGNQDYSEAARLFTQAAIENDSEAQRRLSLLYLRGHGVQKNPILAYAWVNVAATNKLSMGLRDDAQQERYYRKRIIVDSWPAWLLRKELAMHMTSGQLAAAQGLSRGWKRGDNLADKTEGSGGSGSPESRRATTRYGSGFFVTQDGYFLTNHHVVADCKQIKLRAVNETTASVVAADKINDIALLKADQGTYIPATFRSGDDLKQGEDIVVFGYPLSEILSSTGNLTVGVISAVAGIGNNINQIQITAPVQPGASGAALLDNHARISGMVVSKLDAIRVAKFTGDIPQNVNFAIKGSALKAFLGTQGIQLKTVFFSFTKSGETIAEEARKFTASVACAGQV